MGEFKIRMNIDTQKFSRKPTPDEVKYTIRKRLCNSNSIREVTPDQFIESVKMGLTFTPAVMNGTKGDSWESQQVICIDIDNDTWLKDESGIKTKVRVDDPLDPEEARAILVSLGITPYFIYSSFSNSEVHPKFRIVWILDNPITDRAISYKLTDQLIIFFNSKKKDCADPDIKDNARLFFGSKTDSVLFVDRSITALSAFEAIQKNDSSKEDPLNWDDPIGNEIDSPEDIREKITNALSFIPNTSYDIWKDVGIALKNEGFSVNDWDQWSYNESNYKAGECVRKWNTFQGSSSGRKLTYKTIFRYAYDNGWKPNKKTKQKKKAVSTSSSSDHSDQKANSLPSDHPHSEIWKDIESYSLNQKNQIVYVKSEEERIPLCHGSIIITEVIYKNDGEEDSIEFKCEGITEAEERLPEVTIPVNEFNSLNWIQNNWGCSIVPFGTQSTIQRLVCGIKLTGQRAIVTRKHCHSGYVNDQNGKPIAYLHAGGSIGNQGINCELDGALHQYMLSGCSSSEDESKTAFLASLSLLQAHRESVTYPLLSFVYLAPIAQINKEVNGESGFCLYLRGKTQNGKSTLSALAMSHFGEFTSTTPPTSFESTSRYNEYLSSLLKDSILWIDDLYPKPTRSEQDKQNEQVSKIARASGDRAFRGRLNSNAESGKIYIPRCLYLLTGEDYPKLSQSGLARIFTIDVKQDRKNLSSLFQASRNGLLSRAMSDYISYIIEHYEEAKRLFEKHYRDVISYTRKELGENRLSIQSALLISSFGLWLYYAVEKGFIDKESAEKMEKNNRTIILRIAHKNEEEIKSSDPVEKFISALSTMISNKEVEIRELKFPSEQDELYSTFPPRIGWCDEEFYYLDKEKTFSAVKEKLESVDDNIGATMKGLYRDMLDQNFITGDSANNPTKLKNINGKPKRLVFIRRTVLEIKEKTNQ